jgi:hypothetical protein
MSKSEKFSKNDLLPVTSIINQNLLFKGIVPLRALAGLEGWTNYSPV